MEEAAEEAAASTSWLRSVLPVARMREYLPAATTASMPRVPGFSRVKRGLGRVWQATLEAHGAATAGGQAGNAASAGAGGGGGGTANAATGAGNGGRPTHLDFPSFWHFFTSRYSIVLLILSLLVNRIHAVVPPSNRGYISTRKIRAIVRAPAILLLARACFMIVEMTMRMNAQDNGGGSKALGFVRMGGSTEVITGRDHSDIMWACFVAACMGVCSESFIRALDHE